MPATTFAITNRKKHLFQANDRLREQPPNDLRKLMVVVYFAGPRNDPIDSHSLGLWILSLLAEKNAPPGFAKLAERLSVDPTIRYSPDFSAELGHAGVIALKPP